MDATHAWEHDHDSDEDDAPRTEPHWRYWVVLAWTIAGSATWACLASAIG